mmetsp:Transcript_25591/g.26685  ORF Transcript_25591/g.26685 Transcript_25591/m.26685 type:complete len:245 (+) Transcript_25591:27-761(+)
MNDLLTAQFINVDSINYRKQFEKIDSMDLKLQDKIHRRARNGTIFLLTTGYLVTRKSKRLIDYIKKKVSAEEIEFFPTTKNNRKPHSLYNQESLNRNISLNRQYTDNIEARIPIVINPASKTYSKKSGKPVEEIRKFDRPDVFASDKLFNKLDPLYNKFVEMDTKSQSYEEEGYYEKGRGGRILRGFLKVTLIWLPIFTFSFSFLYNLAYSNLGYYMKYQPLVDAYYESLSKEVVLETEKAKKI